MQLEWIYLITAGFLEISWAVSLKYTAGFTVLLPSLFTAAAMLGSVYLLDLATKEIPIGTAYAVWTGIGAAGTAVAGIILFGESHELWRFFCIFLIIAGVVGLKINIGG
ncbi:DMT family transporter [Pectinatus haikarae]|uniref:Quaternary ammonium compound-resistance protein SugE n=1 Tax=Pectinatus haikarae TaxID=349096 RepID=A0ABT9Y700_9FIRM|nr:SMR family transporter [Pectinatus haikarae]MDQ0203601.1 quaternary ammonium compound-resistance protein SugE [Pectinatus haikarae]